MACTQACCVPLVLVMGGGGAIEPAAKQRAYEDGVKTAAQYAYKWLCESGSVLGAVQAAVCCLDERIQFNTGYGAALTWNKKIECSATIMDGTNLRAGCVTALRNLCHPINLARGIMDKNQHVGISGLGALEYAHKDGSFDMLPNVKQVTASSWAALQECKSEEQGSSSIFCDSLTGAVGVIAIDCCGNLAAATSSGGPTGKLPGHISCSGVLGAGLYAQNRIGAAVLTGNDNAIHRYNAASRTFMFMKYEHLNAQEASHKIVAKLNKHFMAETGCICVDQNGMPGIAFNMQRMSWCYQRDDELHYGMDPGEDICEIIERPTASTYTAKDH